MIRREMGRRVAALEAAAATKARASLGPDLSMLTDAELRELRGWLKACGDRDLNEWRKTLPQDERERVRAVLLKLAAA